MEPLLTNFKITYPSSTCNLLVAWIHPGTVRGEFLDSVVGLYKHHADGDIPEITTLNSLSVCSGPLISRARNQVLEQFLARPTYTHLLCVDSDIQFTPGDVQALLAHNLPFVGGLYFGFDLVNRSPFPVALRFSETRKAYTPLSMEEVPKSGLVDVDAVGAGFMLMTREMVQKMEPEHKQLWPFAEEILEGRALGEDVVFCRRAKAKGFDIKLSGDARVGHAKTMVIGG